MVSFAQALIAIGYVTLLLFLSPILNTARSQVCSKDPATQASPASPAEEERGRVPEFAKKMGHEEKWKLHNGC